MSLLLGSHVVKSVAEMIEHIPWQQGFLARAELEHRNFSSAPAYPRTDARGIEQRQLLRDQRGANAGEHVAHSAGRHSGMTGRIVTQRFAKLAHDRSAAFQQKRDWKMFA